MEFITDGELRSQLWEIYQQRDPLEQQIVQLLSVVYGSIEAQQAANCFKLAGLKSPRGKVFTAATARALLKKLTQAQLLLYTVDQRYRCHPLLVELATRDAIGQDCFSEWVNIVQRTFPPRLSGRRGITYLFFTQDELFRSARIALYQGDYHQLVGLFEDYAATLYYADTLSLEDFVLEVATNPFDLEWAKRLPAEYYTGILASLVLERLVSLEPVHGYLALLETEAKAKKRLDLLQLLLVEQYLLCRRWPEAARLLARPVPDDLSLNVTALQAGLAFFQGEQPTALSLFDQVYQTLRKREGQHMALGGTAGVFYMLALLKSGTVNHLRRAAAVGKPFLKGGAGWLGPTYQLLYYLAKLQQGDMSARDTLLEICDHISEDGIGFTVLFRCLCLYWLEGVDAKAAILRPLGWLAEQGRESGYDWLTQEAAELLSRLQPESEYSRWPRPERPLVDLLKLQSVWELSLQALANLGTPAAANPAAERRMAWFISLYVHHWIVQPKEQKLSSRGSWTRGRAVALSRLAKTPAEFEYLTPQDLKACNYIKFDGYARGSQYVLRRDVVKALVGHPHVYFEESPTVPVEVVAAAPELVVEQNPDSTLTLRLEPSIPEGENVMLSKETPTRLRVLEVNSEH